MWFEALKRPQQALESWHDAVDHQLSNVVNRLGEIDAEFSFTWKKLSPGLVENKADSEGSVQLKEPQQVCPNWRI